MLQSQRADSIIQSPPGFFVCEKRSLRISLRVAERAGVLLWIHTPPLRLPFPFRDEFGLWGGLILQVSVTTLHLGFCPTEPGVCHTFYLYPTLAALKTGGISPTMYYF